MAEVGIYAGGAIGGPVGALGGSLLLGAWGVLFGDLIGSEVGKFVHDFLREMVEFRDNYDFSTFMEAIKDLGGLGGVGSFLKDLFDGFGSGDGGGENLQFPPPPVPPRKPNGPDDKGSPLVLDLGGQGIDLYARGDYGTYFDLLGTGQAVLTGWVSPEDGLLALPGVNGVVDDISELFGNATTDGFTILAAYDSNGDKVIDANDTIFGDLRVWTDLNSDGISQSHELHTLSDLGITAISLITTRLHEEVAGNTITHEASFTINGNEQRIADAWFSYDPLYTRNNADYTFDIRTAFLPTLKGFGALKDLHIAASTDNDALDTDSLMARLIGLTDRVIANDNHPERSPARGEKRAA